MTAFTPPLAIGCMRLSTEAARDDARALATLHAALDAGVTLLDTADAYALDQEDAGHNERLVARALATWSGDAGTVRVATKGGLTRPARVFRPAYIQPRHGIRSRTRLYRLLYVVVAPFNPLLKALLPRHVTTTERIGRAMIAVARTGAPKRVLENVDINAVAAAR